MAFIITENKSGPRRKIPIQSEVVIGRHPSCEIVLDEGAVSRQHAKIYEHGGHYLVEDLNSRNGTYLNNRPVHQPTRLLDGDRIQICEQDFTFQINEEADDSAHRPTGPPNASGSMASVLLDDVHESSYPSIMSQMEVASHYESASHSVSPQARLNAVMEITRALAKTVSLEEVLPSVLDCLFNLFRQVDRGSIVLVDEKQGLLPLASKVRRAADDENIRLSRTIVKHVLDSQQAIISADAAEDSRFDLSQSISDFRIRSLMCAPLIDADGKSLGVIQLDTLRNAVGFSEEDLEILITVAMQAGLAVDNARLHQATLQKQAMDRDLELAHEVQHRLLPSDPPPVVDYELYDYYRSADKVGGDYFDYVRLEDGRVALIVADVVGHGVAAALLMAKFSAEVRFALATATSASQAMNKLNRSISGLQLDRFITVVLVVLDPVKHVCSIVNAGHLPPIVRRQDGTTEQLSSEFSGLPIGIFDDYEYRQIELELKPGDVVALYTDGINEAHNADNEMFGNFRVVETIKSVKDSSAISVGDTLTSGLKKFMQGAKQTDDICLVILSRMIPK
ncbi:MAG TPA: SpoIIE family protein phosphatase [Pirellulaceae bacterium]|nr:SpoIIE family protein phosphatase [Pirellulaceae bacterium]HMO90740.1 SpoIIE family protein phosphatase [Pirellulaceae bacterium]HMP67991.1 SpoIIE family protein phosphatase [Pirellulaceae bacterium]